jgi:hypothetical protein
MLHDIFKMLGAMEPKIYAIINLMHVIKHKHATVLFDDDYARRKKLAPSIFTNLHIISTYTLLVPTASARAVVKSPWPQLNILLGKHCNTMPRLVKLRFLVI